MRSANIQHNLTPDELRRTLAGLAKAEGIAEALAEDLRKATEEGPHLPESMVLRELNILMREAFEEAVMWCGDFADQLVRKKPSKFLGVFRKAIEYIDEPLTAEQLQALQEVIEDRFAFLAAQIGQETVPITMPQLTRWQNMGLVEKGVTAATFGVPVEQQIIRNAFVFGRLADTIEKASTFQEAIRLAAKAPLVRPDFAAIAVAERTAGAYLTAIGNAYASKAVKLALSTNREIVNRATTEYFRQNLMATVVDAQAKKELGLSVETHPVEGWREFAGELRRISEPEGRDWSRVAFNEIKSAECLGHTHTLLEKFGPGKKVFRVPMPTACAQCKELFLGPDGKPRIFTLGELIANGNNVGRRAMPTKGGVVVATDRPDGVDTLKAVTGPVHPWCECGPVAPVTGLEFF